jgi:beta-xylosidase
MGISAQTVLDAVRGEFPDSTVRYEQGCAVTGDDRNGIAKAVEAAADADLTILVVGDRSGMFGHGTSGEGCDVATLDLPGVQAELVDAVGPAAHKTILVLLSGNAASQPGPTDAHARDDQ